MPSCSVLILLHLYGNLRQVHDDVLHLGIGLAALGTSQVVQPRHRAENKVGNSNDDGNTDRVTPNNDNGDDAGSAVGGKEIVEGCWVRGLSAATAQPSEDTEEGGDDIDGKNGAYKFP